MPSQLLWLVLLAFSPGILSASALHTIRLQSPNSRHAAPQGQHGRQLLQPLSVLQSITSMDDAIHAVFDLRPDDATWAELVESLMGISARFAMAVHSAPPDEAMQQLQPLLQAAAAAMSTKTGSVVSAGLAEHSHLNMERIIKTLVFKPEPSATSEEYIKQVCSAIQMAVMQLQASTRAGLLSWGQVVSDVISTSTSLLDALVSARATSSILKEAITDNEALRLSSLSSALKAVAHSTSMEAFMGTLWANSLSLVRMARHKIVSQHVHTASKWAQEAAEARALVEDALYHDTAACPGGQCDVVRAIVDVLQGEKHGALGALVALLHSRHQSGASARQLTTQVVQPVLKAWQALALSSFAQTLATSVAATAGLPSSAGTAGTAGTADLWAELKEFCLRANGVGKAVAQGQQASLSLVLTLHGVPLHKYDGNVRDLLKRAVANMTGMPLSNVSLSLRARVPISQARSQGLTHRRALRDTTASTASASVTAWFKLTGVNTPFTPHTAAWADWDSWNSIQQDVYLLVNSADLENVLSNLDPYRLENLKVDAYYGVVTSDMTRMPEPLMVVRDGRLEDYLGMVMSVSIYSLMGFSLLVSFAFVYDTECPTLCSRHVRTKPPEPPVRRLASMSNSFARWAASGPSVTATPASPGRAPSFTPHRLSPIGSLPRVSQGGVASPRGGQHYPPRASAVSFKLVGDAPPSPTPMQR